MDTETAVEPRIKVLSNGARYDLDKKRIVSGATLTSAEGRDLALARRQRKAEVIAAAANAAVERGDYRTQYGDMAFVAEIAANAQRKATTQDDPKAIDAARFLLQETGLAEPKQAQEAGPSHVDAETVQAMLAFAQFIERLAGQRDAVEGSVVGGG